MAAWLVVACSGPDPSDAGVDVSPPSETGRPTFPGISAFCDVADDNELRIECNVDLLESGPAQVVIAPEDGSEPPRTWVSASDSDTDHRIIAWDLRPDTPYTWAISSAGQPGPEGVATTGTPEFGEKVGLEVIIDGESRVERLLVPYACGAEAHLVAIEADGTPRWYSAPFAPLALNGFSVTDRETVLAVASRTRLVEMALDGSMPLDLSDAEGHFDLPLHHDAVGRFGETLVLRADAVAYDDGLTYVMDGFYEADATGASEAWSVDGALDPRGLGEPLGTGYWLSVYSDAVDFGHANSIDVDERGVRLVSFKHLDTVMAIDPDGSVRWTLAGGSLAPAPGTLTAISSAGLRTSFEYQHHAYFADDGHLWMFDNGRESVQWSRVIELVIDEVAGTADVVSEYVLDGARCPIMGSGVQLENGSVVAACAANRHVYEFDEDGTLRREVSIGCPAPGVIQSTFVRALPIEL